MSSPSAQKLSPIEIMALVVLMAEAREIRNPDLKELSGVDLSGTARTNLLRLGLVSERKVRRANAFALTPKGWSTAVDLVANVDKLGGPSGGTLTVLLQAVGRALAEHGLSAEKFFDTTIDPDPDRDGELDVDAPRATATPAPSSTDAPTPATSMPANRTADAVDPETAVRQAYARLATRAGAWVTLADLRDALVGLSRGQVDGALRTLARQSGVELIPVANLKALEQRDKDAALRLGGDDNHVLSIEAS